MWSKHKHITSLVLWGGLPCQCDQTDTGMEIWESDEQFQSLDSETYHYSPDWSALVCKNFKLTPSLPLSHTVIKPKLSHHLWYERWKFLCESCPQLRATLTVHPTLLDQLAQLIQQEQHTCQWIGRGWRHLCQFVPILTEPVSYTHLTLPTIYSV